MVWFQVIMRQNKNLKTHILHSTMINNLYSFHFNIQKCLSVFCKHEKLILKQCGSCDFQGSHLNRIWKELILFESITKICGTSQRRWFSSRITYSTLAVSNAICHLEILLWVSYSRVVLQPLPQQPRYFTVTSRSAKRG